MLAIGVFRSWCVDYIVVWSDKAESYHDGGGENPREDDGGEKGVGGELPQISAVRSMLNIFFPHTWLSKGEAIRQRN